jgi:hypothetical protein
VILVIFLSGIIIGLNSGVNILGIDTKLRPTPTPQEFMVDNDLPITPQAEYVTPTSKPVYVAPKQYVDSDPFIKCNSSQPECSGSSLTLRKSQCTNVVCCRTKNGWRLYESNSACDLVQASEGIERSANQEARNKINEEKNKNYISCRNSVQNSANMCKEGCNGIADPDEFSSCLGSCTDSYIRDMQQSCEKIFN